MNPLKKLICYLLGHKIQMACSKFMTGYTSVYTYCSRCDENLMELQLLDSATGISAPIYRPRDAAKPSDFKVVESRSLTVGLDGSVRTTRDKEK